MSASLKIGGALLVAAVALAALSPDVRFVVGCNRTPPAASASDAADPCAAACAALSAAGCPMGGAGGCPAFMQNVQQTAQVRNPADGRPLTCADVAAVKTRADAQQLGFACPAGPP